MGVQKNILIVSSDYSFASLVERELGPDFEIHAAATDIAAYALMDAYAYACVVIDLSARSVAGSATVSGLRISALTIPVVALVPPGSEDRLPPGAIACISDADPIPYLARMIREAIA
jgi:DNA-binding response OmpR family regulator